MAQGPSSRSDDGGGAADRPARAPTAPRRGHTLAVALGLLSVLAVLVGACSAGGGTTSDAASSAADDTGSASDADADADADPGSGDGDTGTDEASGPSGTIRAAPPVSLVTLDPHNFIGGGQTWLTPVYEPLFRQVLGEEDEIQPLLATGYEMDGTSVTITLRDDVTFSDGEPFDAEAVKVNLERGRDIGVRPELAVVDTVEAVDDTTVAITLTEPAPGFIANLASIPGYMISPAALDDPALDRNPVGTGPWVYAADESREGEVHVYTLNEDYWDPSAQGVERIEVFDMPDMQARVNALKTGQLDLIAVSGAPAEEVGADPALGLISGGYGATFGVPVLDRAGSVVPAFASREVRQAMSMAIDREAFVEAVYFGRGVPNIQPAAPGDWAHNDALDDDIGYDPDRARELLAEAGYPDGFSFTIPSIPPFDPSVEVLGEFWRDIGLDVTVEALEPGTLAGRSRTTDFPITMLNWVAGNDPSLYVPTYLSDSATFNPFQVPPDPRITELAAEGVATEELDERAAAYHEMAEVIAEDLPVIYVASPEGLLGSTAELATNQTIRFDAAQREAPIWHGLRLDG